MIAFLGNIPTPIWFLLFLGFLWGLFAVSYLLGAEAGEERGFKLGYARGKLVGTQEANYLSSIQDRGDNRG